MNKTKTTFTAYLSIKTIEGESPDHFRVRCEDFIKKLRCLSEEMELDLVVSNIKAVTHYYDEEEDSLEE